MPRWVREHGNIHLKNVSKETFDWNENIRAHGSGLNSCRKKEHAKSCFVVILYDLNDLN